MNVSYYPGCSLDGVAREYGESTEAVARILGIELEELEDWSCCGAASAHVTDDRLALALPARNLGIADKAGLDLVVPCAACYSRLKVAEKELLAGKDIVVTAGGTQEPIDPVRCITNRSSGKMGYALAEAARDRGAKVTLITAPTWLVKPIGMKIIDVCTAQEIHQAVGEVVSQADVLIMAAAVADYRPVRKLDEKMKRKDTGLTLELERTPDILGSIKGDFIKVGFAAESSNLVENAKQKLQQKGLHLIVANDITASDSGFGADSNRVTIVDREGKIDGLPLLPKREVADKILDKVAELLDKR